MKQRAKRAVLTALTTFAATAAFTVATTTPAFAINYVNCGPSDYLTLSGHTYYGGSWWKWTQCFANGGEASINGPGSQWADRISTGNNRVQWYGDGRWQPATPIGKNTVFTWPNYPGGVSINAIRIV